VDDAGVDEVDLTRAEAGAGALGGASATTASVSSTGRSAVAAGAGAAAGNEDELAATGAGMAFCREARYPPPAAAAMHAAPSAVNASRFETMETSLET
jgi:hypothetical protein